MLQDKFIGTYILKDKEPIPEGDTTKWALWFQKANTRVGETFVGKWRISTVFLGIDYNMFGKPHLFETMVFEREPKIKELFGREMSVAESRDELTRRYATWEEAERGHREIVAELMGAK